MTVDAKTAGMLDWLRGPPQGTEDSKKIFDSLTKASNEVSRKFQSVLVKEAPQVMKQAKKFAKKYGVDPLYVQFVFVRPGKTWPVLPPMAKQALEVAQLLVTEVGDVPSFGNMQIPPSQMDVNVDAALSDLGDWAARKLLPSLRKQYYAIVEKAAKPQVTTLRRPKETLPALQDVSSQVSGYFKHLLRSGRELSPMRLLMFKTITAFS